ncbi:hypothetical protein Rhe02_44270 [Rhizocola hellebori]|uniref:FtsX-like permease family protein n=1 Tax=Rhizocola hellebori TaxID=1392758 RepID=A0A8J3Q9E5_9ACTN|nr:hypothetical protein [Rhizocola hellebori]GIH06360.1 hypothetical protein Rhe02_44270 [Rhizocola hellebori]
MRPATLLRLAFAGSLTDRVRAGLTVIAAALAGLAILATGAVLNMAPTERWVQRPGGQPYLEQNDWRYTTTFLNSTGLRPGLIVMATVCILPALFLIAQAARLGGPARDRRLATMRLAGATPQQSRAIAAAEQGIAVGLGALLAMAAFPLLRLALHRPTMEGVRAGGWEGDGVLFTPYSGPLLPLPTDTAPAWWSWPLVALGLPVAAALLSSLALRRVFAAPTATVRRARRARPRLWPLWLMIIGLADLALCRAWIDRLVRSDGTSADTTPPYVLMGVGVTLLCVGVPMCAAAIGWLGAKAALRWGRSASTLIAARRVLADPYSGSRAVLALLVCAVLVAGLLGYRINFDWTNEVGGKFGFRHGDKQLNDLVLGILDAMAVIFVCFAAVGLLIALVDAAMTRRRIEAALLATGTSQMVLVKARLTAIMLTAVPGVLLGLSLGYLIPTLALPPVQDSAVVITTCHGFDDAGEVPCTPQGLAQQERADRGDGTSPAYGHVQRDPLGPWHNVYPPIPWDRLAMLAVIALAAVAAATVLSLMIGGRTGADTALRTT